MIKKAVSTVAIAGAALCLAAPSASAVYYSYGVLYAKEGTTTVAEGKGTHGVDFPYNAAGGHIGSRDPRPGGSPAYGEIGIRWYYGGAWWATTKLQSTRNSTSTWKDQAKYTGIPLAYDQAVTYAKACQDDTAGPDACAQSDNRNHKW